jgi:membrane protein
MSSPASVSHGWLDERRAALRLAVTRSWEDNLPFMASALGYSLVFAIFPALIVLVAVLDLLGRFKPVVESAVDWVLAQPSDSPWRALEEPLDAVLSGHTPAWSMLLFGGLIVVWTAGNYIGSYQWSVARIRREPAGRPYLHQRALQVALAVGAFVVIFVAVMAALFAGPLTGQLGDLVGAGDTTRSVWSWLRWPVMFLVIDLLFSLFYQMVPEARREHFGLFTTGGVVAIAGWLLTTGGFSLYVKYIADYHRLYGTLGAFIAFLTWLWLFNLALLASTEIDAALEEVRAGR